MLDVVVAMTDIVTNYWSLGLSSGTPPQLINHGFKAKDGWFVMQVGREAQFAKLVALIGHPEWMDDPRFASRALWLENLDGVLRPAIEELGFGAHPGRGVRRARPGGHRGRAVLHRRGGRRRSRTSRRGTCSSRCRAPTTWSSRC